MGKVLIVCAIVVAAALMTPRPAEAQCGKGQCVKLYNLKGDETGNGCTTQDNPHHTCTARPTSCHVVYCTFAMIERSDGTMLGFTKPCDAVDAGLDPV
ncbi:MAG TPA: hypothetical protein VFK13_11340 [Gemmatimonadaceae bacterium]|nr:hypothetical protein [Gemmatimonadaceae bacterium]